MAYLRAHEEHIAVNPYVPRDIVYLESHIGKLMLQLCGLCEDVKVHCLHLISTWEHGQTDLICDLCGKDVT